MTSISIPDYHVYVLAKTPLKTSEPRDGSDHIHDRAVGFHDEYLTI